MTDTTLRMLFLCTQHAARTQMAEVFLHHNAGDCFEVCGACLTPTQVHPLTRQILMETGLDPSGLHAKSFNAFLGRVSIHSAMIVGDQVEEHCPRLFPFALQTLSWPFDDSTQMTGSCEVCVHAFRNVWDEIVQRVHAWLATLEDSASRGPSQPRRGERA